MSSTMSPPRTVDDRSPSLSFWAPFGVCLLFLFLKSPGLLLAPRFWGEEATVYFAYAHQHGFFQSLFLVPTSTGPAGYLLLAANLPATIAARCLPLEWAPWPMTLTALVLQALPFALILSGTSRFFRSQGERLLACLVLLFAPSIVDTVWLNAINAQIFCGLIAVLLLGEDLAAASRRRRMAYRVLLIFCLLSGPYAAFLTPAFALKHWRERQPETRFYALSSALGAVLQASLYLTTWLGYGLGPDRFELGEWARRSTFIFHHQVLRGWLGEDSAGALAHTFGLAGVLTNEGAPPGYERLAGWVCLALIALFAAFFLRRRPRDNALLLVIAWLSLVLGISLSIGGGLPVGRYAVLPGLVALFLVFDAARGSAGPRRWLCGGLLGLAVITGWVEFWQERPVGILGRAGKPPEWTEEVDRWRSDPDYPLRIWPYRAPLGPAYVHLEPPNRRLEASRAVSFEPVRLISTGELVERTVPIHVLPRDFKIYFDVQASQSAARAHLRVRLRGAEGELIAERRLRGFRQQARQRFLLQKTHFKALAGAEAEKVRAIGFALQAPRAQPIQVWITSLHRGARVEGLLEPVLPRFALPRELYPRREHPIAAEATSVLLLESLRQDGDTLFRRADQRRARELWPGGQRGLRLVTGTDGRPVFAGSTLYPRLGRWWVDRLGLGGLVLFNLFLIAAMSWLAWRFIPVERRADRMIALAFILGSGIAAYAWLPQPEIWRMFCLFVPTVWWMSGHLEKRPLGLSTGFKLAAAGALLAAASFEQAPFGIVFLGLAIHLAVHRAWKALVLALAALIVTLGVLVATVGRPVAVDEPARSTVSAETAQPDATDRTPRRELREAWRWLAGDNGLIFFYPFALLAVILFATGPEDHRRSLLFAVLLVLCAFSVVERARPPSEEELFVGGRFLVVIYPLFLFLPHRWRRGWPLWCCLLWCFFWTVPHVQQAWREATFEPSPVVEQRLEPSFPPSSGNAKRP